MLHTERTVCSTTQELVESAGLRARRRHVPRQAGRAQLEAADRPGRRPGRLRAPRPPSRPPAPAGQQPHRAPRRRVARGRRSARAARRPAPVRRGSLRLLARLRPLHGEPLRGRAGGRRQATLPRVQRDGRDPRRPRARPVPRRRREHHRRPPARLPPGGRRLQGGRDRRAEAVARAGRYRRAARRHPVRPPGADGPAADHRPADEHAHRAVRRGRRQPAGRRASRGARLALLPGRVGPLVVFVYVHQRFIGLGLSLANLFELATDEQIAAGPDAVFVYGAPPEALAPLRRAADGLLRRRGTGMLRRRRARWRTASATSATSRRWCSRCTTSR